MPGLDAVGACAQPVASVASSTSAEPAANLIRTTFRRGDIVGQHTAQPGPDARRAAPSRSSAGHPFGLDASPRLAP